VLALGAAVWTLALVGIVSVARAAGVHVPLVGRARVATGALTGTVINGLPEFPGAKRSEFREEVFGDERVTEIEYLVGDSVADVRAHYRDAFARGGWTVLDTRWEYGEWCYAVRSGLRHGAVEIEHRDGLTEVEVEMAEPSAAAR